MGWCADCYICCNKNVVSSCCTADGDEFSVAMKEIKDDQVCYSTMVPCYGACKMRGEYDKCNDGSNCHLLIWGINCLICLVPCLTLPIYRYQVRKEHKVEGSCGNDCFQSFVCYPCTIKISNSNFKRPQYKAQVTPPSQSNTISDGIINEPITTGDIQNVVKTL